MFRHESVVVASTRTVKDRFLFLFKDILAIGKQVAHDENALFDVDKASS